MDTGKSTWLKAMQNGALGEARAKAFLMNRFWVLERSVDIDGADYLIQRRLTKKDNYTNSCLGIVQVKFFENNNSPINIPIKYVVSDDGKPRTDFFLLLFTGDEDCSDIFYLDTKDILEFNINPKKDKYYLTGTKLKAESDKYLVKKNSHTLKRIEDNLAHTTFLKNKSFITNRFPGESIDPSVIMPEFREPIDNWWGNIPKEFEKVKNNAIELLDDIGIMYEKICEIAIETSPMEAMLKAELMHRDYGSDISEKLFDENLYYASKVHLEKVDLLRNDGLLDNFILIKNSLKEKILPFIEKSLPIDSNTIHKLQIEFHINDFQIIEIEQSLLKAADYFGIKEEFNNYGHIKVPDYEGFKSLGRNRFEYFWLAGRCYLKDETSNKLNLFYSDIDLPIFWKCMDKMFELKYYEE